MTLLYAGTIQQILQIFLYQLFIHYSTIDMRALFNNWNSLHL